MMTRKDRGAFMMEIGPDSFTARSNIAMPELVILTGEGIRLAQVGRERVLDGVRSARNPEATALDIRVLNDDPQLWARGAAAVAIQRFVLDDLRWSGSAG